MSQSTTHPASWRTERLLAECSMTRQRRSGPGGQHRNKVETAVVIEHTSSGIRGQASERRSQEENRAEALFRLRLNLAVQLRTSGDEKSPFVPSALWRERTKARRIAVRSTHDDFPALLAEALDVVAAMDWNVAEGAELLGVTTTQLTRLFAQYPAALERLNAERLQRGLKRLR